MTSTRRQTQPVVTPADVETAIKAHFDALEKPGGALYAMALAAADRRGRDRVLRWIGRAVWAVVLLALGWGSTTTRFSATRKPGTWDARIRRELRRNWTRSRKHGFVAGETKAFQAGVAGPVASAAVYKEHVTLALDVLEHRGDVADGPN